METLSYPREIKANKDHRCDFCCDKIAKGEVYITSTHKYDGRVYDWKTHKHCSEIAHRLKMYEDCDEGVSGDDFRETICSVYFDLMLSQFSKEDLNKYSDAIQQFRNVLFSKKLMYVIRHYSKIDKLTPLNK